MKIKYFKYRKLGIYQADLKRCATLLQQKDNLLFVSEYSQKARERLTNDSQQQALESAWNTYHKINSKAVAYNPHEKEILEEMAHMQSSENGWKTADDMLNVCNRLEVPWYAKGSMAPRSCLLIFLLTVIMVIDLDPGIKWWFAPIWFIMCMCIMISMLRSSYSSLFRM